VIKEFGMDQEFSTLELAIAQLIQRYQSAIADNQNLNFQNQQLNSQIEQLRQHSELQIAQTRQQAETQLELAHQQAESLSKEKKTLEQQLEDTALRIQTLLQSLPT
jgi:uncharacterized protein involved in exopolysaccharide biosynthesis